jgi:glucan biosynthesis protein C
MKTQIAYPQSEALLTKEKAIAEVQPRAATRLLFVDNIRIYLTILVILHHLIIIYSGAGGWIWHEGRQDEITSALGSWFTAVDHSYFMGLFLLIAAYFVPGSYDRKGAARFLKDRLIRLGIPLAVYSWIIRPLFLYAGLSSYGDLNLSLFVSALLLFSVVYAIVRLLMPSRPAKPALETSFPRSSTIAIFAVMIALASFIVRLWFPSDWVFAPLAYQFADFPQYIALFIVGLVAYRQNWLVRLPERAGRVWMTAAAILILLYPPIAILGGALADPTLFKGGWHWQALLAALWQSFLGLSMCVSIIYLFQRRLDRQGALGRFLSPNAYTAYLIHEPVITFAALFATGLMLYPLLKFGLMALMTIPLIFGLSSLMRRLPYTQRVL